MASTKVEFQYQKRHQSVCCAVESAGRIYQEKVALVTAWAIIHKDELEKNWLLMTEGIIAPKIKPLS